MSGTNAVTLNKKVASAAAVEPTIPELISPVDVLPVPVNPVTLEFKSVPATGVTTPEPLVTATLNSAAGSFTI